MDLAGYRKALRSALSAESKAYGFTLVVWGAGALVMGERGLPGRWAAVAYVGGLLAGVSVAIVFSFGGVTTKPSANEEQRMGAGGIHVASVGSALAAAWSIAALVPSQWLAYLLAGLAAGLVYQLVLGLEMTVTPPGGGDGDPDGR